MQEKKFKDNDKKIKKINNNENNDEYDIQKYYQIIPISLYKIHIKIHKKK